MHMKPKTVSVIIGVMMILGGLSSCASVAAVPPQSEIDTYINTAVSATLVQYIIETKVAAQASQEPAELIAQAQPTETPSPTPTLIPTIVPTATSQAPTPSSVPTAAPIPAAATSIQLFADLNTNCRYGPGKTYAISGTFLKGTTSEVHGRDSTQNWWYIVHPSRSGQFCWVWDGSTTIQGDPSGMQVVDAPAVSNVQTSNIYYYDDDGSWYQPYYYGYPQNVCGINTSCGCGSKIIWKDPCKCNPTKITCCPVPIKIKWDPCHPFTNKCKCGTTWSNPCKKSKCPAVTAVNINNYCKNYPNCCD